MQKILQSPFTLLDSLVEKTRRETELARQGKPARIIAKMNALIEPQIIQTLYQASMAGVKIDLIVRGICALRPGVLGVSENISVRSIIGRFLEHSRVFYFHNNGDPEIYCASADWMERNFFRRIEVAFPIERKQHRDRIVEDLETYLADNTQAWVLNADGAYERIVSGERAERFGAKCTAAKARRRAGLSDFRFKSCQFQQFDLLLKIRRRQRMILDPAARKLDVDRASFDSQLHLRRRLRAPSSV